MLLTGHPEPDPDEPDDTSLHLQLSESSDSLSDESESEVASVYSGDESSVESDHIGRYKPPMRRRPGETGVLPRNANLPPTRAQQFRSFTGSSESEEVKRRPQRRRQKPNWMRSNDWVVGQLHTFTVDPGDVVYI